MEHSLNELITSLPGVFGFVPDDVLVVGKITDSVLSFGLCGTSLDSAEFGEQLAKLDDDAVQSAVLVAIASNAPEVLARALQYFDKHLIAAIAVPTLDLGEQWLDLMTLGEGTVGDFRTSVECAVRVANGGPIFPNWNAVRATYAESPAVGLILPAVKGRVAKASLAATVLHGDELNLEVACRMFIDAKMFRDAVALADKNARAALTVFTLCARQLRRAARYRALFAAGYAAVRCAETSLALAAWESMGAMGISERDSEGLSDLLARAINGIPPAEAHEFWESGEDLCLPGRVTATWLRENVGYLRRAQIARLVEELRSRGWSQTKIRDALVPLLGDFEF